MTKDEIKELAARLKTVWGECYPAPLTVGELCDLLLAAFPRETPVVSTDTDSSYALLSYGIHLSVYRVTPGDPDNDGREDQCLHITRSHEEGQRTVILG